MREALYVYGSGGHGKVVATVAQAQGLCVEAFLDDDPAQCGKKVLGLPVIQATQLPASASVIVGIGDNHARKQVFAKLDAQKIPLMSTVHPSGVIHPSVKIGKGTVVMPGVIINVDTSIGENVILNTGVCVDHDCRVGAHAHLAPGVALAGHVTIGEGAFLGVGVRVIPGIRIGAWATVGAGAVVLEDVPENAKVAGVPARAIA